MSTSSRDVDRQEGMTQGLMDNLIASEGLEEGELYVLRRKRLTRIPRNEDEGGLHRVRVTEEAYTAALAVAQRLRHRLHGYRPDPFLVLSALVLHAARQDEAEQVVWRYLQTLFSGTATAEAKGCEVTEVTETTEVAEVDVETEGCDTAADGCAATSSGEDRTGRSRDISLFTDDC